MSRQNLITDVMLSKKLTCQTPETTVAAAARKMSERKIGAVMVTYGTKLLGIVTERDINFRVVAAGRDPQQTSLWEIMTDNPDTLLPTACASEALDMMQKYGYRHVPVASDGEIIGVVSIRDLFLEVKRELEEGIYNRDQFIYGTGYSVEMTAH